MTMKCAFLPEPELQFGVGTHIDIRYGLTNHSPLDFENSPVGPKIRIGLVGSAKDTQGMSEFLDRLSKGIEAKKSRQPNLFVRFPGFGEGMPLPVPLVVEDVRVIPDTRIRGLGGISPRDVVRAAADLYLEEIALFAERKRVDVVIGTFPAEILDRIDEVKTPGAVASHDNPDLRDFLKAEAMRFAMPTQFAIPPTYGGKKPKHGLGHHGRVQDEATRAWNLYVACYYKAGGRPWRLVRNPSDFTTCFVGVSFYLSLDRESLHTSLAHIFNERGEGVIVRGAHAHLAKVDRSPYLQEGDAHGLLCRALKAYRKEHHTQPARVVVHKTSRFEICELDGLRRALQEHGIERVDFVSIRKASTRLFRDGRYPPARGTLFVPDSESAFLYTRGSVPFYETYPGMYVPRALELSIAHSESAPSQLAAEALALTKLNWNDTQLDGGEPVTIHAARVVGDVLKYVSPNVEENPHFAYYM